MEIGRITILGDSPGPAAGGRCQTVSYMVSGNSEQHRTISCSAFLDLYLSLELGSASIGTVDSSGRWDCVSVFRPNVTRRCRPLSASSSGKRETSLQRFHTAQHRPGVVPRGVPHGGQLLPPVLSHALRSGHAQRMDSLLLLFSTFVAFIDKTTTWENLIVECFIPREMHVKI